MNTRKNDTARSANLREANTREEYEDWLIGILAEYDPYLVVLSGWDHIFGKKFTSNFKES